jgi:hypothetical protein
MNPGIPRWRGSNPGNGAGSAPKLAQTYFLCCSTLLQTTPFIVPPNPVHPEPHTSSHRIQTSLGTQTTVSIWTNPGAQTGCSAACQNNVLLLSALLCCLPADYSFVMFSNHHVKQKEAVDIHPIWVSTKNFIRKKNNHKKITSHNMT